MQIDGLSRKEIAMLNIIWSCDGEDQFMEWFTSLNDRDRLTVESLLQLLSQEVQEEMFMRSEEFPEAAEVCRKFMLNGNV
jgi:hypothetical protein